MKTWSIGRLIIISIEIIAICIILIVVLSPLLLRHDVSSARKSNCQSNLKECAIAIHMYMDDNNGCLPSSALVRHSKKWNKRDFLTFATKRGEIPPSANDRNTWSEIMYDHLKNRDIMFCPSDETSRDNPHAKVSYWWKLAADKAWYGEDCVKRCQKEGDFSYNSDQVIFYERNGWHSGCTDGLKNGAQINVAYLDTHVRTITIKNATSGDPVNCAANSDGEPMYFNYDMKKGAPLADGKAPAEFIDPGRYSDSF